MWHRLYFSVTAVSQYLAQSAMQNKHSINILNIIQFLQVISSLVPDNVNEQTDVLYLNRKKLINASKIY